MYTSQTIPKFLPERPAPGWSPRKSLATSALAAILTATIAVPLTAEAEVVAAKRADSFVDSIGFNVHMGYDGSPYATNPAMARTRVSELGVRHLRDALYPIAHQAFWKYNNQNAFAEVGAKFTMLANGFGMSPSEILQSAPYVTVLEAFEGENEVIHWEWWGPLPRPTPERIAAAQEAQKSLFNTIQGSTTYRDYPVLGMTWIGREASSKLGNLSAWMDFGNCHPYPLGTAPGALGNNFFNEISDARTIVSPGKTLIATETGYQTGVNTEGNERVSERAQAKYMPRLFLTNFNQGLVRTFSYELANGGTGTNQEQNFGIYYSNWNPKPAATAIANLAAVLKEATLNTTTKNWDLPNPGFSLGSLNYTLTGATGDVKTTLLRKGDGKFYLCLWREVSSYNIANTVEADINNADAAVTLTLTTPISAARLFRPNVGAGATAIAITNSAISLNVPDEVIIVELTPGAAVFSGIYELEPTHAPGMRLDVSGAANFNGANVQLWSDTNNPAQRWQLLVQADGSYELVPQCATSRRLDVDAGANRDGANVHTWIDNNSPAQRWDITEVSAGIYELAPRCATTRRMGCSGAATGNGTNVLIWSDINALDQRWRLLPQ